MSVIPYNKSTKFEIFRTKAFTEWYEALDRNNQWLVDARLERIQNEGHFGTVNRFAGLLELKWKSGLRVYTALRNPRILVLVGGNKNGQNKDISKAKKLLSEIDEI